LNGVDDMSNGSDEPLELSPENLRDCLLRYNYFPFTHEQKEEMPPIFGSQMLISEVAEKIGAIGLSAFRKRNGYDSTHFKRTRHPGVPRILGIPHPKAYVDLVSVICKNWTDNILNRCQSENSVLTFEIQSDFRLIVHSYNSHSIDNSAESTNSDIDFGSNYRVRTDIANFYRSIYSHSLPWALVGIPTAKQNIENRQEWYNEIDRATRISQRNETKGITIGPATSSILSEIILFPVDAHLRERGYRFYRYIDDYTCFVKDRDEADQFLIELSRKLEEYSLHLNAKKTEISAMPIPHAERWVVEMNQILSLAASPDKGSEGGLNYRQLRLIIDKAILLNDENPDGSVAKYAFAAILEIGISDEASEKFVEDALLKYAFYYPSLVPVLYRWLQRYSFRFEIGDRLYSILEKSFRSGHSDNIVWCIFMLIRADMQYREDVIKKSIEDQSPMVILMAYVYAKSHGESIDDIQKWAMTYLGRFRNKEIVEHDLDQYWIVLY
jgi:hypothetical protein